VILGSKTRSSRVARASREADEDPSQPRDSRDVWIGAPRRDLHTCMEDVQRMASVQALALLRRRENDAPCVASASSARRFGHDACSSTSGAVLNVIAPARILRRDSHNPRGDSAPTSSLDIDRSSRIPGRPSVRVESPTT
jgi:hypothetical protein